MGRSQFYKGDFDEAASTFTYMCRLYKTQPAIYGKARAWLAKCYIEQDWIYDAEDVTMDIDLGCTIQLDKLLYLPREDAGNGTLQEGTVTTSYNLS